MQRPKPISRKVIARPEDYVPSHPDSIIVGTFNAPITLVKDNGLERILTMVRVAEKHKSTKDGNLYLPHFEIPNQEGIPPKMDFDVIHRDDLVRVGKKEVKLKDGTERLRHISLPRKMLLDLEGNVIERQQTPAMCPGWEYDRFGIEDLRITHMEDGEYVVTYVCPHREEGVSTVILKTEDFRKYINTMEGNTPRPTIPSTKDIAVFSNKVPCPFRTKWIERGTPIYAGFSRPSDGTNISPAGTWVFYSPDLVFWGLHHRLTRDKETTGTGSPPIKYQNKWIAAYHKTYKVEGQKNPGYKTRLLSVNAREPWKDFKTSDDFSLREDCLDILPKKGYVNPVEYTIGMVEHDGITITSSGIDDEWDIIKRYYTEDLDVFIEKS